MALSYRNINSSGIVRKEDLLKDSPLFFKPSPKPPGPTPRTPTTGISKPTPGLSATPSPKTVDISNGGGSMFSNLTFKPMPIRDSPPPDRFGTRKDDGKTHFNLVTTNNFGTGSSGGSNGGGVSTPVPDPTPTPVPVIDNTPDPVADPYTDPVNDPVPPPISQDPDDPASPDFSIDPQSDFSTDGGFGGGGITSDPWGTGALSSSIAAQGSTKKPQPKKNNTMAYIGAGIGTLILVYYLYSKK